MNRNCGFKYVTFILMGTHPTNKSWWKTSHQFQHLITQNAALYHAKRYAERFPYRTGWAKLGPRPRVAIAVTSYQKLHNRVVVVSNKYAMIASLRFMPLITPLSRTLTLAPGDKRELNTISISAHARRTPSRPLGSSLTVLVLNAPHPRALC